VSVVARGFDMKLVNFYQFKTQCVDMAMIYALQ